MVRESSSGAGRDGPRSAILWAFADRRFAIAGLWLLGFAGVGLSLVLPSQVGRLTQLFAGGEAVTWPPVLRAVLYLVAAQLGLSAISYVRTRAEVSVRESAIRRLMLRLYGRIVRFGADFFRSQDVERINARAMEDTNRVGMFWAAALVAVPLALASIVVLGAVMLLDNWLLGLCMIALSVFSGYFIIFDRELQAINHRVRETWETIRASARETVAGVAEVRNHCAFEYALGNLGKSFHDYEGVMGRFAHLLATFQAMDPLVATVQRGALFAVGAALCIAGSRVARLSGPMTWGQVIKFMFLAQLFQDAVAQLAGQLLQWRMTRESERRVGEYLRRPCVFEAPDEGQALPPEPVPVAYERVSVAVETGQSILREVSLRVEPGQHVVLCGPSGCGKSTLLQALVRGVEPSGGCCTLASVPLERYALVSLARRVGFVPQTPVLFNTTIRQNLLLALRRRGARCLEDDCGPIDLHGLDGVQSSEDLDRELVAVARLVGLEADLIAKCLDAPLPPVAAAEAIVARIGPLRARVAQAADACPAGSVVHFQRSGCFPGTVGENLLGPGASRPAASPPSALRDMLAGQPVLLDLLRVGYRRLVTEQALAARVSQDRPGLMELLPHREAPDVRTDRVLPLDRVLLGLSALEQVALLDVAVESDIELARQLAGAADFDARLLAARHAIGLRDGEARRRWDALDGPAYADGLTLRENLLRGRANPLLHGAHERLEGIILHALRDEGLLDAAVLLGLEFVVGEGGKFLSGGQRQKVAIARVILKNPILLLLDEATASLDEASQARVLEMVGTRFARQTVISISHRLSTARDCGRVVVMDRGQVVQDGTYDELARQEGVFRRLVSQERGEAIAELRPPAVAGAPETARQALEHAVARSSVFGRLKSDQLAFLAQAMRTVTCPRGEVLFRRGDAGSELYVILDGEVEFFVERGEGDQRVATVVNSAGPGGVFGELAMFGGGRRTLGARAATEATLGILRRDDLVRLIHADPTIAIELLGTVSRYLARATDAAYDSPAPKVA